MIRPLAGGDLPACAGLFAAMFNAEPWNEAWTAESAARYLRGFFDDARFAGFALFEGGAPVGAALCHANCWYDGDELHIDEFFVAPPRQGQGAGRALVRELERYAAARGLRRLTLLTDRRRPAFGFYGRLGFSASENLVFLRKNL